MGHGEGLPAEPPQTLEENEDFLKKAHHVLLEVGGSTNPPYWRWVGALILPTGGGWEHSSSLLEVGGSTHPPYWRWVGALILPTGGGWEHSSSLLEVGGSTHPPYWRWVGALILPTGGGWEHSSSFLPTLYVCPMAKSVSWQTCTV